MPAPPRGLVPVTRPLGLTYPPGLATDLVDPRRTSVRKPMVRQIAAGSERQKSVAVLLATVDYLGHRVSVSNHLGGGSVLGYIRLLLMTVDSCICIYFVSAVNFIVAGELLQIINCESEILHVLLEQGQFLLIALNFCTTNGRYYRNYHKKIKYLKFKMLIRAVETACSTANCKAGISTSSGLHQVNPAWATISACTCSQRKAVVKNDMRLVYFRKNHSLVYPVINTESISATKKVLKNV